MPEPRSSILPVREIVLTLLLAAAAYLFLAIVSYSPLDPAWTFSGTNADTANLVGESGALVADVVLLGFGWIAYLLPLALFVGGLRLLRRAATPWSWPVFGTRFLGWVAAATAACVLVELHVATAMQLPADAGPGGIVGDWLGRAGMPFLNWAGVTLVAVAVLLIGVQAALGYSWIRVAEGTGRSLHLVATSVAVPMARGVGAALRRIGSRIRAAGRSRRAGMEDDRVPSARRRGTALARDRRRRSAPTLGPAERPEATRTPPVPDAGSASASATAFATASAPVSASAAPAAAPAAAPEAPAPTMPDLALLDDAAVEHAGFADGALDEMSRTLESKLADFGIEVEVTSVLPGPVVTRFEIQPAAGIKVSRITALVKDLARSLAVVSVRIVEVIPGKSVVGIEIPNERRESVRLKDTLASPVYQDSDSPLTIALGRDIAGAPVVADIARMPHLLIAGTTGAGKSVGVNAMLLSMLYKATPEDLRLILIDPKILELSVYEGIPHLLAPVVTDMKDAAQALHWCVAEMERRYRLMAALRVRNLDGLNKLVAEGVEEGAPVTDPLWEEGAGREGLGREEQEPPPLQRLPFIVVIIDELADLMMTFGKKVDQLIARIAQKARAAGIHLVLATQRPSVDVITGLIKANVPARMSFQVSSRIDSRTILDQGGAEQLLGYGDMLFLPPGTSIPIRVHGAFVSDQEVLGVVADWKARGGPDYREDVLTAPAEASGASPFADPDDDPEQSDALYDEAVAFVIESRRASISAVQRKLRIGYNRAARLIETMEEAGVVSAMNGNGSREVLVPDDRSDR